ncbi:MAG: hypothetical protein CBC01_02170 [Betaproteobacteria bacterium TMED41]|nr:MAG: hypothetical protein CBC01_02170 [Betaproteobacteria bacterium TMED41]
MSKELTLSLLGIKELWFEKKNYNPKLIISFDNLSNEGLILLKNMLFSISIFVDKDQIKLIDNFSEENFFNYSKSKIFVLTNKNLDSNNDVSFFICPHPSQILADSSLKAKAWIILISMKRAFNESF